MTAGGRAFSYRHEKTLHEERNPMKLNTPRVAFGLALAVSVSFALTRSPARAADDADMYQKGVDYLVKHQNADGSWGEPIAPGEKPGEIGITALAVKTLAPIKGEPYEAVQKGVAYLLAQQQPDGSFTHERSGLTTYRTALTVMALVSVDKVKHKDAIEKGVKWLEGAQFGEDGKVDKDSPHYGGWGYDKSGTKPDADLSNTHLALAALKEAGVKGDDPVMKRAVEFLSRCQNNTETNKPPAALKLVPKNDGGFYYGPSRATVKETKQENADGTVSYESYGSMTYAGLVSLCYAGLGKDDARVKAALGWIKGHYTLEENAGLGTRSAGQIGLYYYYYAFARALDALETDDVETTAGKKKWARDLLDALKARQKPDGSWVNEADRFREGSPSLVTAYCLNAIDLALKHK
jgi:squalene-hopene/tetraprenyl-beta-curcumene cyclase